MSIKGNALDRILKIDDKDISHGNGVTVSINRLKNWYKKDELNKTFEDLERLEVYKRSLEVQMQYLLAEFDQE